MAMGMGIQPTATTPPTMATLTLTVHAITDIGGHSTSHTWAIAVPTMPGLMAGAIDAPTMRDRTAGDIAGHTGGSCWHPGPGCLAIAARARLRYGAEGTARAPGSRRRLIEPSV